jgi:hypothetical protein
MNYDNFASYPLDPFLPLIFIGEIIAVYVAVGLIIESLRTSASKRKALVCSISALAIIGGLVASIGFMFQVAEEVTAKNNVTAENNIKKKYDIEAVLWDKSYAAPDSTDLREIVIQDKNSNILKFQYRIDKETHEPYFLNDSGNAQVKANDLLLNKQ